MAVFTHGAQTSQPLLRVKTATATKMADENGNGWWNSWIQTAKEKTASVFELVRQDLAEFTETVQHETSSAVSAAASSLKEKLRIDDQESTANQMKRSVSTFLGSVSTAFTPVRETEVEDVCVIHNMEPVVMDRLQLQLLFIQRDQSTYVEEPNESQEHYEKWLENFDLENKHEEIRDLVVNNSVMRAIYAKLVPISVSHMVFWHRYFYRVQQLTESEQRRFELKERVSRTDSDDRLSWDEDDDLGHQELTTQQTDLLLLEYQKECELSDRGELKDEENVCQRNIKEIASALEAHDECVLETESPLEQGHEAENECPVAEEIELPETTSVICHREVETSQLITAVDASQTDLSSNVKSYAADDSSVNIDHLPADTELKSYEDSSISNEEEWERDFDIGDVDAEDLTQQTTNDNGTNDLIAANVENDWERWE